MTGFFKLGALCFSIVTVTSFMAGVFFAFLSTSKKATLEYRERCEDAVFRCLFAAEYSLVVAAAFLVLWIAAHCWSILEIL